MTVTTLPGVEYPADTLELAARHGLRPEVADVVLTVAHEAIRDKFVQTPDALEVLIAGELDEPDEGKAAAVADDAAALLGYRVDC